MTNDLSNSHLNLVESSEKICCSPGDMNSFGGGLRFIHRGHYIRRPEAAKPDYRVKDNESYCLSQGLLLNSLPDFQHLLE